MKPGEGRTALLLMLNLFALMTVCYILKPIRESLILADSGPELKSYAGAVSAMACLIIVPIYGKLASRLDRIRLINGITAFFGLNLIMFYVLGQFHVSFGFPFFLWVGLFDLMLVAQFWALANDLYTQEQGTRLFGVIGIGSSLGAIFGSAIAGHLFLSLGIYPMMLVAAGLLAVCMALTSCIHQQESSSILSTESAAPLKEDGAFQLVFRHRYLFLIAILILLSNVVNATGEFILGKSVTEHAKLAAASGSVLNTETYIGTFYSDFYFWVNIVGAGLQMFLVSRIMKNVGTAAALFFLPIVSLGGYTLLSFAPLLSFARAAKIAENGTDYSIQNTARHALFLSTSREAKYKGKTAIDSFFWRAGDAVSALIVFTGTALAFDLRGFARTNVILAVLWLCVAAAIGWLRLTGDTYETAPLLDDSANADA